MYVSLPLLLYVSGLWADFYLLLIALFTSLFIGLLAIFAALCNTVTFIYRFSSTITASLLRVVLEQHLYLPIMRRR